jgi:uncharacterized HhH-GPD family protein
VCHIYRRGGENIVRAERLLTILHLLQAHTQLTARDLARRLEVSTRTVQRDLDALSLAGVPVYASRGRAGGWTLAPGYRTSLTGLTPAEAMTVFVGRSAQALADLGLDTAARSAAVKLLSALPVSARRDAEFARERILLDHSRWERPAGPRPSLAIVQQALFRDEYVRLGYGSRPELTVAPLGLVAKASTWYLLARREDGELRTYRMSRVRFAALTGRHFERPPDFDLAVDWRRAGERFLAGMPSYPVRLRVRTTAVYRLSWAPSAPVTEVMDGDDGWSTVAMTFENVDEARLHLLTMAGDVRVDGPAELRDALTAAARSILAVHDGTAGAACSGRLGDMSTLHLAQEPEADRLLANDPLALLTGMLLDQQIPLEKAFTSPYVLAQRLGVKKLDAELIAGYDPEALAAIFTKPPALHRFPGSMAGRVQALCVIIRDEYDGDAAAVWSSVTTGAELVKRLKTLPGFGAQKAQIFAALLGKQLGVQPDGWREAAGPYGEEGSYRSVADIVDAASLSKVREYKKQMKAAAKAGG